MRLLDVARLHRRAGSAVAAVVTATALTVAPLGLAVLGAPAASAQSSPPTCQGTAPLGMPGAWSCTFDDEFNGTSLNTTEWMAEQTAQNGYTAGPDCYVDSPSTIAVSGGYLSLSVRKVPPFTCGSGPGRFTSDYAAGEVMTYGLFDQTYGAFEVNAKLPASTARGLQETMWLYPQHLTYGQWPGSGEIDFAEFYSEYPTLDVPYIHDARSASDPDATAYDCTITPGAFNTYGVDWKPGVLSIYDNGKLCLTDHPLTGSEPFNEPFFMLLTAALGEAGSSNAVASSTATSATTEVDWVRAWEPTS